jgi:hypothetical protein
MRIEVDMTPRFIVIDAVRTYDEMVLILSLLRLNGYHWIKMREMLSRPSYQEMPQVPLYIHEAPSERRHYGWGTDRMLEDPPEDNDVCVRYADLTEFMANVGNDININTSLIEVEIGELEMDDA